MKTASHKPPRTLPPDDLQHHTEILDKCLQALDKKQATIEGCVQRYPDFVELGDMLRAAAAVQQIQPASLSQMSKNNVQQRMLAQYRGHKPRRVVRSPIWQVHWLRPVAALCCLILFILLGGFGLVTASAATLPGDTLYPVKRFAENVQIALTPVEARASLYEALAETRLSEVSALADANRTVSLTVLGDADIALNTALDAQPDLAARQHLASETEQVLQKVQASRDVDDAAATAIVFSMSSEMQPTQPATLEPVASNTTGTEAATHEATQSATESATDVATDVATEIATQAATMTASPIGTSLVGPVDTSATMEVDMATPAATDTDTLEPTLTATFTDMPKPTQTPKPRPIRKFTQPAPQSKGSANNNANNSNSNGNNGNGNGGNNNGGSSNSGGGSSQSNGGKKS